MNPTSIFVRNRWLPSRYWFGTFSLLLLATLSQAQTIGDYRSVAGGLVNFVNRPSWERWDGSAWVTNSAPLDYTKTFTITHTKTINATGITSTINRIIVETDNAQGTAGVLNVNGRLVCNSLEVKGVGAQVVVKSDIVSVGSTSIGDKGSVSLLSDGNLGTIAIDSDAKMDLLPGVSTGTVVGPITVSNGGLLTAAANGPTITGLTLAAGGQLQISAQVRLAKCLVENGGLLVQRPSGQPMVMHDASLSGPDLIMLGQYRNESNTASVTFSGGAEMQVAAGAVYTHAANGGQLPLGTWDPASTLEIKGVIDASAFSNDGQTFGNVIWDTPDYGTSGMGSNVFYLNGSGNMKVAGKLLVRNTGLGRLQLTPNTSAGPVTTQLGSYEQQGGQVCVARFGSSLTRTVSVSGNFVLGSGRFELSNSSSSGAGILAVDGHLQLDGGTLLLSGGSASGTVNLSGDLLMNTGSDLRREVTGGVATVNFAGTQVQHLSRAGGTSISGAVDFQVLPGATLDLGTQILDGEGDFVLNAGATLRTSHSQGIAAKTPVASAYTGNVQVTGTRSYSTAATYVYNGTTTQQTGTGLPASLAAGAELVIDNAGNLVALSRATSLAGTLRLRMGRLLTSTNLLTLTPSATWTEASDNSYVDGPLARQTNNAGLVYTFPIGDGGRLKVAGVRPGTASNATFRLLAYNAPAPNATALAAGSGLFTVSRREYWELTRTAGTASAAVRLYYTVPYSDVQETPQARQDLRIAAQLGGEWNNYGQAGLPNTVARYLDAGLVLALTNGTAVNVTFGTTSSLNPLPVTMLYFRAKQMGKDVQLTWRTAQEQDCAGFEVQASNNGIDYQVLDYYNGRGTTAVATNYAHLDANAFRSGQRLRYYRLRQLDTDGKFHYSIIVTVAAGADASEPLTIWPVPATNYLNIALKDNAQNDVTIRVVDALGRICRTQQYSAAEAPDVVRLPVDQLHRGLYFVQVETKLSRVQVRFQKE
ncbi:hypothetical protein GCM10027048_29890 [Hymenobacter coalescens]